MAATTRGKVAGIDGGEAGSEPADPAGAEARPVAAPPAAASKARRARRPAPLTEVKLNFWSRSLFYLMVGALHVLSLLPDFLLYPLGIAGGYLFYLLDRRHGRIGMRNLAIAFPDRTESDRRRILRASYINLGRGGAEYIRLGGFFYRRLKQRVLYERYTYWQEIQRQNPGKGLLILSAHFGNFELLAVAHAMHGHQISLVHHTQRFAAGDALMTFVRERAGVTVVRKHAAARGVLRSLRRNELVGIPFDQNAKRSEAIFVPFFGELAATSSGLARLVAISGAPVVPVFIVREPNMRSHRIEIQDQIAMCHSGDSAADIEENTRRFVGTIEAMVRRYPEQFLWTHRRYRTRPRGAPKVYDS